MKPWKRWAVAALAVLLPGLGLYALTWPWPDTPDGLFHLHRVRELAEALRWGVLYPRWFPDFAFGYGYPVLNFYAPAFYYPPALLHLAGLDVITAVRVVLALAYGLSGLAAYGLLRRWARPWPAALGALLYLAYPYRLYDLFVRGALPEFAAFLWLPLVALTTLRWMETGAAGLLILAGLSWAGLILTHNLSALMALSMAVVIALAVALICLAVEGRERGKGQEAGCKMQDARSLPLAFCLLPLASCIGLALSAPYIVPALAESPWVGLGAVSGTRGYAVHFSPVAGLFAWSPAYPYPDASLPTVPAPGYALVIVVLALVLAFLPRAQRQRVPLAAGGMLAVVALWLTTEQSAWAWDILSPLLGRLQFPWRWQTMVALALGLALASLLDLADQALAHLRFRPLRLALPAALSAFLLFCTFAGLHPQPAAYQAGDLTPQQMWAFDAEHGQVGATWTGEFLPRWVQEQRWAIGREPEGAGEQGSGGAEEQRGGGGLLDLRPPAQVRVVAQGYLHERLAYEAAEPATLVFHTFYYPAWRVEVDGQPVPAGPAGELGLLSARVPAGRHELARRWVATPAVLAGWAVWGATWLGLGVLIVRRPRRWKRPAAALWLVVSLIAVIGASGLLAVERQTRPIGVSYGFVRLESAAVTSARPGETAVVALTWLVVAAPEPVTAFVHVVGPDGRVVAQHDGPLGGPYTPAGRWLPGELLPDEHPIPLPPDLAPGTYLLKAGLYRPGSPEAPLSPSGWQGADARVEIGSLEVRP
ncbi:MAG: hypothetical protein QHJ81_12965 [Anaerolineae bacterium]|nr:hypothetical protein [Anaerolineae bacterium]